MLHLQRISQRVRLLSFRSINVSKLISEIQNAYRAANRLYNAHRQFAALQEYRGFATGSEPYDAVVIGGGANGHVRTCIYVLTLIKFRSGWLRGCYQSCSARLESKVTV